MAFGDDRVESVREAVSEAVSRVDLPDRLGDPRTTHVALLGSLLVALALRAPALGANSFWIDESATLSYVTNYTVAALLFEQMLTLDTPEPHPPLYYVLVIGWSELVGVSTARLRVPSVAFGVATVYLCYAVGRELVSARVGLLAALFLAVSPMHVQYSREARMYALLVLLALASMYLFVRLLDRSDARVPSWRETARRPVTVGYVVVTALLLYVHVYALFFVIAQNALVGLWLWSDRGRTSRAESAGQGPTDGGGEDAPTSGGGADERTAGLGRDERTDGFDDTDRSVGDGSDRRGEPGVPESGSTTGSTAQRTSQSTTQRATSPTGVASGLAVDARSWLGLQGVVGLLAAPWLVVLGVRVLRGTTGEIGWLDPPGRTELAITVIGHTGALVHYPFASYDERTIALAAVVVAVVLGLAWVSFVGYREGEDAGIGTRPVRSDGIDAVDRGGVDATDGETRAAGFRAYLRGQHLLFAWLVVPVALPFLLSHVVSPIFYPRYTIVAHAAVWLVAAVGITRLDRDGLRWLLVAVLVGALLASTTVLGASDTQEDWRGAAETIDEEPESLAFVTPDYTASAVGYYATRPDGSIDTPSPEAVRLANDPLSASDETVAATLEAVEAHDGSNETFYVVALAFDQESTWIADLEANLEVASHERDRNVEVYQFVVDGDPDTGDDNDGDNDAPS